MTPMRILLVCSLLSSGLEAADWPQWGGRDARNMVSAETGLPASFDPGKRGADGETDMATTRNVKWVARLGTETYGNPTVAGGRVFVGTNNGAPRDPRLRGDRHVLMCFDEATGKFLWQFVGPKLRAVSNFNGDFNGLGVCSSPTVDGDRVYITTSRCDVVCLDVQGLANGNDGPFVDEGKIMAVRVVDKPGTPPRGRPPAEQEDVTPLALRPDSADVIWRYDMIAELDVWPQDATDCSILVHGDLLYVCTSNGVDKSHRRMGSPKAPTLIVLDKRTGKLVALDDMAMGPRVFHGLWSSPSLCTVNGRDLVLFGGGDGFCYALDPKPVPVPGTDVMQLKTVWRCDCNPEQYRVRDGKKLPYNQNHEGPSEVIATPVFHKGCVYVTIGQDTRHGPCPGALTCIDATKGGVVRWQYRAINRSFSTPSVADGLVFAADVIGDIHCLDALTGERYWVHAGKGQSMGSTFVADGKVYVGNRSGKLTVLAAAKEKKVLAEIQLHSPIHCTPIVANGVLYVACHTRLYAVAK